MKGENMRYPARFEAAAEGGYVVTFRDVPEAITQGDTYEEAVSMAEDVLKSAMDFYFDEERAIPAPSKAKRGEVLIDLPASVSAKAILLNEMIASGVSRAELARRMGTSQREVQRIVDLRHATKIDTLEQAIRSLGKHLDLRIA
jgi:antitoxin HicB